MDKAATCGKSSASKVNESVIAVAPDLQEQLGEVNDKPLLQPLVIAPRLTGKLRAPGRVLVIWSPGMDGDNDGGRILYDLSNGTISDGDTLIFSERY